MNIKKRILFHIDMNAFFASCEQVIQPSLKGKPIIVCGDPKRRSGIVLAASYEAKAFGIKTTMPIFQAQSLCPQVILVKSTFGLYSEMSKKVMTIFDDYTPLKEQLSIDEAFLDMTGTQHLFGPPLEAAKTIQKRILEELDLGCSVGIANNKLLAKMASDMKKPLGITTLYPEEVAVKLWPLEVGELYGIGKKSVPKLKNLGIDTIGDLANMSEEILGQSFGYQQSAYMLRSANGIGNDQLDDGSATEAKSVGNERTYPKDITDLDIIKNELLFLADTVGYRLRKKMLIGRTIQIKIKYNDFKVITRSKTLKHRTDSTDIIYTIAMELVTSHRSKKPIRLLGVSVTNFEDDATIQLSLFEDEATLEHKPVDTMVDQLRTKFGYTAINRASLLDKKSKLN